MSIVTAASLGRVPRLHRTVPLDSPHEPKLRVAEQRVRWTGVDR